VNELTAWRLCMAKYAATAFSGEGAKRHGGRWSPAGWPVVYLAESRALAALEVLANVDDSARLRHQDWVYIPILANESALEKPARVPESWRKFPHAAETQQFGAAWLREARSAVLRVPSAIVPGEFNYLLNPAHPGFAQMKIGQPEPFSFDPRLG
jgi:RES domain-containing protein